MIDTSRRRPFIVLALAMFILGTALSADPGRPDIMIADLRKTPLPAQWTVEGYAFGTRKPGSWRQQAARTTANQRQYESGKLISPEFTILRSYIVMELGGTYHPEKCCVALVVGGRDIRRISPGESGHPWSSMDVRELGGKKARLEVRDSHFNGWVALGRVLQTDSARNAAPQATIPSWEPAVYEAGIDKPFLLLPVGGDEAPLQTVTIEIDGEEKLAADMPLSMDANGNYLPAYDLTGYQGKTLRVHYHRTAGSRTDRLIRLSEAIPKHEASEKAPAFHVHCRFGRLNDTNGLVYHDNVYHLFHQYFYGPRGKHWAHYVSTDLVHWRERPIGLYPDETGSMHSGSGAVDWHNTGGFQKGDKPAIIAAFTGSRGLGGNDKIQVQGIAYSTDGGRTFTKYGGNPVIGQTHLRTLKTDHSRDPKIFWYSPTRGMDARATDGHWGMVLFEDGAHSIFTSSDLKSWAKQGSVDGFHECPELFPLAVDGNAENIRWVMYGANGAYHIGSFDGKAFKPETKATIRFNHGGPHYAAQTFSNTAGMPPRRIQMTWQRSQISFPVELSLCTTPLGLRLCALPVREIRRLYASSKSFDAKELKEGQTNPLAGLRTGLYDIELDARFAGAKQLELTVRGKTIRYDVGSAVLRCDKHAVKLPGDAGRLKLRILVDNCSIDISAGEAGLFYMPIFFGPLESRSLSIKVTGGSASFDRLRVHELRSIWR
ncbi:MAG TPA: glycoside hydrolase family 32 protein [Phycisphaerae bacterium]|nr:glycoside hydrolase family 32 protein [Phycisphaerae bacterium]